MTVPSKMFALKTFSAKDKSKNYYVADCITLDNANTPYLQGYSNVSVFIDEPMYNSLLSLFEPLMDVVLDVHITGTRVNYTITSL